MIRAAPAERVPDAAMSEPPPGPPCAHKSGLRPSPRSPRWARWVMGSILVLCAAGALAWIQARRSAAASGAKAAGHAASDVPRTEGNRIVFTERFRQRVGIKTVEVTQAPLVPVVSVVGTATFSPAHTAAVGARVHGLVRRVIRFEGDEVKEGDVLAQIDSPELAEAQASVVTFRAEKQAATLNANREQDLKERQLSTAREFEQSRAELERYRALLGAAEQKVAALGGGRGKSGLGVYQLRAPMTGVVVERHIAPGQSVLGDVIAYRVSDLNYLWVELALYEKHLRHVRVGDQVEFRPLNAPEEALEGRVKHIAAQIDPLARTAELRVEIDNHDRKLRPGQSLTARIQATGSGVGPVRVIPASAVTYVDGKSTVFVAEAPNVVTVRTVELGQSNDREQQVLSGLEVGERVVSEGVFALKSELFR
jgi:membrane fusion protein, heavy metal efflux system